MTGYYLIVIIAAVSEKDKAKRLIMLDGRLEAVRPAPGAVGLHVVFILCRRFDCLGL